MISRTDLVDEIWQGRAVSDWAVSAGIKSVRAVLSDTAPTRRYIRTVHGRGFRFVATVVRVAAVATSEPNGATATVVSTSIAVVPFENLSGDPDQDYFADGISEDLITDLSRIPDLSIVSRNGSFQFKGRRLDARSIAKTLDVSHLLEGSVRRIGEALRINVQLVEPASGRQIWAERYDGTGKDVFALQDRINARIIGSLKLRLATGNHPRGTQDPEAYDLCLRGRSEYYLYTPDHLAKALDFFEQAVEKDPTYAEAYAYQSYCRTSTYVFAWPGSDDTLERAISLAEKAISLDPASAVAHARRGWVLGFVDRGAEAVSSFERAVDCDAADAEVYYAYGETMNRLAEPETAMPILDKAFGINSFVPPGWEFAKGHSQALLGRFDAALGHLLPVPERVPRFIPARVQLARVYAEMDEIAAAQAMTASIHDAAPRYRLMNAKRMFPYPRPVERDRLETALRRAGLRD